MSETKWPPGPWEMGVRRDGTCWLSCGDPSGETSLHSQFDIGRDKFLANLLVAVPDLYAALAAIIAHGELANISADPEGYLHWPSGGKKPATKDVWTFPRHMLPDIEAALARARGETP